MTGHQARMLAVGDHVVWTRAHKPLAGRVVARSQFSLKIKWADGATSEMFYNDMKHVERRIDCRDSR